MASTPDMVFADSSVARKYATFRPQPPAALVNAVVDFWKQGMGASTRLPDLGDVGCGSGQSTHLFAPHVSSAVGVDVSPDQLTEAKEMYRNLTNVSFVVGSAEELPFPASSLDLVTVCAAVHWFNLPDFYREVDRVLRPGAVFAVYSYLNAYPLYEGRCLRSVMEEIWAGLEFWTPHHHHLASDYASLPPAYEEDVHLSAAESGFESSSTGDLTALLGYCSSWSAAAKYRQQYGEEAWQTYSNTARDRLLEAMDTTEENPSLTLRYKYFLRMWRKPASNN